jgi:hypothetical protein
MGEWADLLVEIAQHIKAIEGVGADIQFFRGHSDGSWKLLSSLARQKGARRKKYIESILYHDFVSWAGPLLDRSDTSWDILFAMQHHGLPTRLLDWSTTFSVALYFALKPYMGLEKLVEIPEDKLPCVWVLNPFHLNKKTMKEDAIHNPNTDIDVSYWSAFVEQNAKFTPDVVALNPTQIGRRLAVQRGVFTFHADLHTPLEDAVPELLRKFVIPVRAIPDAISFLSLAGLNEYSLFPDLDGLARYLKLRHKDDF